MNIQIEICLENGYSVVLTFDRGACKCLKNFLEFIKKNLNFENPVGIPTYFRCKMDLSLKIFIVQRILPNFIPSLDVDNEKDFIVVRDDADFDLFLRHIVDFNSKNEKTSQVTIFLDSYQGLSLDPVQVEMHEESSYLDDLIGPNSSQNTSNSNNAADFMDDFTLNPSDFKNLNVLGYGQFGTVFKALDIKNDHFVALKCQSVDVSSDVQRKILSELNVLRRCNSPFIIDFHGACFMDDQIAMSTEFMDGGSLGEYSKIEEKILCYVAVAVVKGLQYLWSIKIMHRDVKPSNILVNSLGFIKLCDFGMSIQLVSSIAKSYVGTNAYMAPERLQGGEYRVCSDVWSLGVSLMEMALGQFPFKNSFEATNSFQNPVDLMSRILSPNLPCLKPPEFNDNFCFFVNSCVKTDPNGRPNPDTLSKYSLIVDNDPLDQNFIASWLRNRLETNGRKQILTGSN